MRNSDDISAMEIRKRYLKPPTLEQVMSFIEELGVTYAQFERYYSIPDSMIRQIKGGFRPLPVKLWPLFYEKCVPQYAMSYAEINKAIFGNGGVTKPVIKPQKRQLSKGMYVNEHNRLVRIT